MRRRVVAKDKTVEYVIAAVNDIEACCKIIGSDESAGRREYALQKGMANVAMLKHFEQTVKYIGKSADEYQKMLNDSYTRLKQ